MGGGQGAAYRAAFLPQHQEGQHRLPHQSPAFWEKGRVLLEQPGKEPLRQLPLEVDHKGGAVGYPLEGIAARGPKEHRLAGGKKEVLVVGGDGELPPTRPDEGVFPLPGDAPRRVPRPQGTGAGKRQGQQPPKQIVGGRWPDLLVLVRIRQHNSKPPEKSNIKLQ